MTQTEQDQATRQRAWGEAMNVLCVRLDYMGDVLMTSAAIAAVKAAQPGREVTLLTSAAAAEMAALIPVVDDVIVYDAPWTKFAPVRESSSPDLGMIEQLRKRQFDAAILFTVYSQNPLPAALLCFLADIPLRLAHCHENPYQLLSDWVPDPEPEAFIRHEVRRQLDLVKTVGYESRDERLCLNVEPAAVAEARLTLGKSGVDLGRPWLVMHVGATASSRRYAPEKFSVVADALSASGYQVVFTGVAVEEDLVERVRAGMDSKSYSLVDKLNLAQLAALLHMASLLISNNTGPAHMAAAVGTPVVVLYALTNPQHTPWSVPSRVLFHDVPCKYCYKSVCPEGHHHCLEKVSPREVVGAARELLALPASTNGGERIETIAL